MKSSRRSAVAPFMVMDIMENVRALEASGRDGIHMEVGQPSTPAPRLAREAAAAPACAGPCALGFVSLFGQRRRGAHALAFAVQNESVMVFQADRNRLSLYDWACAATADVSPLHRPAHAVYGNQKWVALDTFVADALQHAWKPICGLSYPAVYYIGLFVPERLRTTAAMQEHALRFGAAAPLQECFPLLAGAAAPPEGVAALQFLSDLYA